jgi:hypothetical protein
MGELKNICIYVIKALIFFAYNKTGKRGKFERFHSHYHLSALHEKDTV